jgi:hypothetical protein
MIGKLAAQKRQMRLTPGRYLLAIVAVGHRAAHHQQQNLRQGMRPPPWIARIIDDGEMIEKRSKARILVENSEGKAHGGGSRIKPPFTITSHSIR